MISKTSFNAIRALAALAELPEDTFAGTRDIAEEIGARPNYLGKLLQQLTRAGLVESRKGMGGGFRLGKPADQISLFDIVELLEHVSRWHRCLLGREECNEENPCTVHDKWGPLRDQYMDLLRTTTVADLVNHGEIHQ